MASPLEPWRPLHWITTNGRAIPASVLPGGGQVRKIAILCTFTIELAMLRAARTQSERRRAGG